ncbi:hypothetical protein SZMC14600_16196 [Saccharomonospora azurea SZMC 14600]|nr:hypothetical protein SZMC14600_16196 [Saccharomonospora azurea SZMC 14600]
MGDVASVKSPVELSPVPVTTAPAVRLTQLLLGLACYGTSMAMMTRSGLGLNPWDVLHEGVADRTGLTFGTVTALTGVVVLAAWIPLRQRPGIGTVANVLVIAVVVDLVRAVLPQPQHLVWQGALLLGGIVLNGLATAVYVGARLGPGPRDGLMTGLSARTNWSVRAVRTAIEVVVLATGWLLGGTVGLGTVLYALAIGPLTQFFLPHVTWSPKRR